MTQEKKKGPGRKKYEDREQIKEGVRFSIKKWVLKKYCGEEMVFKNLLRPEVLEDNK